MSGGDVIPSYRVAVADARTCEWETGIGESLRWSGSCFSKCPIHGIIERRPQSRTKSVTKPLYISTLLRGAVRVTISRAYSMWPRCSPLVVVVVVFIEACLLKTDRTAKSGNRWIFPLAREGFLYVGLCMKISPSTAFRNART